MAKKQSHKFELRDWLLIVLSLAFVATNIVWYLQIQALQTTDKNDAASWLHQQVQINKLKACIDESTKPCDITPVIPE